jgi:hypothetical protein
MPQPHYAYLVFGLLFLILGYFTRERKMPHLIPGYRPDKVQNPEGLINFIGLAHYALGIVTIILSFLITINPTFLEVWFLAVIVYAAVIVFWSGRF